MTDKQTNTTNTRNTPLNKYGETYPYVYCPFCQATFRTDPMDATCRLCNRFFREMKDEESPLLIQLEESKTAIRELVEALEKTLAALVSYKHYVPEPYKQNPIYIIGAHEAEKKAVELISKYSPKGEEK